MKIYGEDVAVKAHIYTVNGFSGHAGQDTLIDWVEGTGEPEKIFLVHGEDRPREMLAAKLDETLGMVVHLPTQGEVIEL